MNANLVLGAIQRYASVWQEKLAEIFYRPRPDQFVLLEPVKVYSHFYPQVLWCQNPSCGRVFDYSGRDLPQNSTCPNCRGGRLIQLRWIKVHRCGHIEPLTPPYRCQNCDTGGPFALDTRGSERISGFRWICRHCKHPTSLFGFYCGACDWGAMTGETDARLRQMDIEVHPQPESGDKPWMNSSNL